METTTFLTETHRNDFLDFGQFFFVFLVLFPRMCGWFAPTLWRCATIKVVSTHVRMVRMRKFEGWIGSGCFHACADGSRWRLWISWACTLFPRMCGWFVMKLARLLEKRGATDSLTVGGLLSLIESMKKRKQQILGSQKNGNLPLDKPS